MVVVCVWFDAAGVEVIGNEMSPSESSRSSSNPSGMTRLGVGPSTSSSEPSKDRDGRDGISRSCTASIRRQIRDGVSSVAAMIQPGSTVSVFSFTELFLSSPLYLEPLGGL